MASGTEPGAWASPARVVVVRIAAVNEVASAARPPTDRSKSPTTITIVWAAATMTRNETVSRTLTSRFSRLRNVVGYSSPKIAMMTSRPAADERPSAAGRRRSRRGRSPVAMPAVRRAASRRPPVADVEQLLLGRAAAVEPSRTRAPRGAPRSGRTGR